MLYYLFVTLYVIACLVLMIVILLQQGKGGDIANAFGGGASQAVFGARAGATVLTKVTTGLSAAFMVAGAAPGGVGLARHQFGRRRRRRSGHPAAAGRGHRTDASRPAAATTPAPRRRPRPRAPPRGRSGHAHRRLPPSRRRRRSSSTSPPAAPGRRRAQLNSETAPVAVFSPLNAEVAELADAPA